MGWVLGREERVSVAIEFSGSVYGVDSGVIHGDGELGGEGQL